MILSIDCCVCNENFKIEVKDRDYENYKNGLLVQTAFPYLSVDDRELIISKTCSDCFDDLFCEGRND
jgi:hypothetical protein